MKRRLFIIVLSYASIFMIAISPVLIVGAFPLMTHNQPDHGSKASSQAASPDREHSYLIRNAKGLTLFITIPPMAIYPPPANGADSISAPNALAYLPLILGGVGSSPDPPPGPTATPTQDAPSPTLTPTLPPTSATPTYTPTTPVVLPSPTSTPIPTPTPPGAVFMITYQSPGTKDPWDSECQAFPAQARQALEAAAAIWASEVYTTVPITVSACWTDMAGYDPDPNKRPLGYGGNQPWHSDFAGAPETKTWYPGALANTLAGQNLAPQAFDMHLAFNALLPWYLGTDGLSPADQFDLVTVAAHTIAHGMGFASSATRSPQNGDYAYRFEGYPVIFDTFLECGGGTRLTAYDQADSPGLGALFTSNDLWWHGPNANHANGGQRVRMYAPHVWSPGSSIAHLDFSAFAGGENQLMVWAYVGPQHDPGPVTMGILQDMGWQTTWLYPDPTPTPTTQPTPSDDCDPIVNCDFELGHGVGWAEESSVGSPLVQQSIGGWFEGDWGALLGGWPDEIAQLSQELIIPTNRSWLHFWYYIESTDACGKDFGYVMVDNTLIETYDLCLSNTVPHWQEETLNLAPYNGQKVTLSFKVITHQDGPFSTFYLDDVTLRAGP